MDAVKAQQMGIGLDRPQIVDRNDLESRRPDSTIARSTSRPIRPKPFMATRKAMIIPYTPEAPGGQPRPLLPGVILKCL